jgi:hypothetical protein
MEIKIRSGKIPEGSTIIAKNLVKKSVVIDKDGNQIDLATKQIIKRKEETQ